MKGKWRGETGMRTDEDSVFIETCFIETCFVETGVEQAGGCFMLRQGEFQ